MLIEFYGKNFRCFRDEFRLSMVATDIENGSNRGVIEVPIEGDDEPLRLLRCAAIYGANASGKSTVIRAAAEFGALLSKHRLPRAEGKIESYDPFLLGQQGQLPVEFGIKAVIDSRVYEYEVHFDEKQFVLERLSALSTPEIEVLLEREGSKLSGKWADDPQISPLTKGFQPNSLLLPLASWFAPRLAGDLTEKLSRMLRTSLREHAGPNIRDESLVARRMHQEPEFAEFASRWVRSADVGVASVEPEEYRVILRRTGAEEGVQVDEQQPRYKLNFRHKGDQSQVFEYARESFGTRRLVSLVPLLYRLQHAEPFSEFIDEFDNSLHPTLLSAIISHVNETSPSPGRGGQLIFATHETAPLDDQAIDAPLRRDQVYFADKSDAGASSLVSLVEFKERHNVNLRKRYLEGRFGGVPRIGPLPE